MQMETIDSFPIIFQLNFFLIRLLENTEQSTNSLSQNYKAHNLIFSSFRYHEVIYGSGQVHSNSLEVFVDQFNASNFPRN